MSKLEKLPRVRSRFSRQCLYVNPHIFNKYILNQKLDMEIFRCHLKRDHSRTGKYRVEERTNN